MLMILMLFYPSDQVYKIKNLAIYTRKKKRPIAKINQQTLKPVNLIYLFSPSNEREFVILQMQEAVSDLLKRI